MSQRKTIITLAVLTAIMPFLGFPRLWEDVFIAAAGVCVALLAVDWRQFRKRGNSKRNRRKREQTEVYVENAPPRPSDEFRVREPDSIKSEIGA